MPPTRFHVLHVKEQEFRHYASPYYDPVKAHEYYMKNRELKGRSTKVLSEEGKEVWAVTKSNISEEKKVKLKAEQEAHKVKMEGLRTEAKQSRERISQRLREVLAKISEKTQKQLEKESEDTQKELEKKDKKLEKKKEKVSGEIERLMAEDYSDLPEDIQLERMAERQEKIAKLQGEVDKASKDAKEDKAGIREDTQSDKRNIRNEGASEKESERGTARAEKEALGEKLKQSISSAREAYTAAKESIKAGYETTFQKEFDKIASEYGGKSSGSGSGVTSAGRSSAGRSSAEKAKIRQDLYNQRNKK